VHVESVAWVSERKDLLCALFFLLSIMAYTRYAIGQQMAVSSRQSAGGKDEIRGKNAFTDKHYLLALGFFILALMSKPMAVTLPVVLLILDWYPFRRISPLKTFGAALIEKLPFVVLSLASSFITILAQSAGKSIGSLELISLSSRIQVAVKSLAAYLGKMLLPLDLIPFYPYPKNISLFSFGLAAAIVLAVTAACVVLAKKQKVWLSVWGYYIVTLIPVLGIVQVGNQAMADRYTYLPSIGPFLIAGLCVAGIAPKTNIFSKRAALGMIAPFAGVLMVLCLLAIGTFQQIGVWKSGLILWDHVIIRGFESATAYNNRGLSLDEIGQRKKAIADFEKAIALDPGNDFAYNNLGVIYGKDGQYQRSIEYFLRAIAINPRNADVYCNLGLSYFNLSQYDMALKNYSMAIELKRDFDAAYLNRGSLFFIIGDKTHALADYRMACSLGNGKACEVFSSLSQELNGR
jgi:hypothetical protein